MSTVTIPNSPVHSDTVLTAVYGETGPNWARFHTGTDFAPTGSTPSNPPLFSVCDGVVVEISNSTTLWHGNMVLIKEAVTNRYWRFCHMVNRFNYSISWSNGKYRYSSGSYGSYRKCNTVCIYI